MNKKMTHILHVLLVALVTLTGVFPVVPAASAAPDPPAPLAERRQQTTDLAPLATDRAASESAAPTQIPEPIDTITGTARGYPSATGDAEGNVYVVWEDDRVVDGAPYIHFTYRPAGGDWQPSVQLDATAGGDQEQPQIAIDGSGNLYAVWEDSRRGADRPLIYFARKPVGESWSDGAPINVTTKIQEAPALAVNRRGEAVVSWKQRTWGESDYMAFSIIRSAGGEWGAPEPKSIASGDDIVSTDLAIDDWGRVYLAWQSWVEIFFAERSPDGVWSANESIRDTTDGGVWGAKIGVDGVGNVHAVWEDTRNGGSQIYAAYRPVGGSWSVNVRIDEGDGRTWSPGLGMDGAGNVIAAWTEGTQISGTVRYLGSGWGPIELLMAGPSASGKSNREHNGRFESGPLSPHAVASGDPTLSLLGPALSILSTFASTVYWQSLSPLGANGCGNPTVARARASAAPNQGGGQNNGCRAGNGSEEAALNGDDGSLDSTEPPAGQPPGGWNIETREVDGQLIYVVDTPGVDGVYTNPGDALNFAQNYVYNPSSGSPSDPDPSDTPDPSNDPPADPPNDEPPEFMEWLFGPPDDGAPDPPADDDAQNEELQNDPFSGEWLQNFNERTEALSLLDQFYRNSRGWGEMSRAEQQQLAGLQHHFVAPAGQVIDLYRRMEQLGGGFRPLVSVRSFAGMTPAGFAELRQDVAAEEARRRAEAQAAAQAAQAAQAVQAAQTVSTSQSKPPPQMSSTTYNRPDNALFNLLYYGSTSGKNADPVLHHSGEFVYEQTFLSIPGPGPDYAFGLSYHSQLIYDGPLGWGWEHSYDRRIVSADGGSLALKEGVGRFDVYSFDGAKFTSPAGRYTALVSDTAGISITSRSGSVESYYALDSSADAGRLRTLADRNGNTLQFAYGGSGLLQTVTDALGRAITYAYDGDSRISSVTDFAGQGVTLTYDDNGDLVSITTPAVTGTPNGNDFPLGKTTMFSYTSGFDDERLNHNLTAFIAPNEVADGSLTPRTINTYGTEGFALDRIVSQSWGGGRVNGSGIPAGGEVTLVYTTAIAIDAPAGAASKVTVNDRGGNEIELWHDSAGHRLESRQTVGGEELATKYAYNADGQMTSVTYPAGNSVEYIYDDGATDRRAQGNLLESQFVADGARSCDGLGGASCADLVTAYTYEPNHQLLQSVTDPRGAVTTHTRDDAGNLLQTTFSTVTVGPAAPQTATANWTYNTRGQPLTFTDAEGNVTCYEYDSNGYQQRVILDCGPSTRSGQALDVATEYGYDSAGNLTVITDSLGVRTEYVFNALGQVVKKTQAAGTVLDYETLYWYDSNDNLVRKDVENVAPVLDTDFHPTGLHSPDGANPWFTTANTYDLLDNLVRQTLEITASAQITTEYRYDPLENLVSVTDPKGNLVEYAYDERSRLHEVVWGVGSTEAITTTFEYDGNGNLVQGVDGRGNLNDYVYDGFDRRVGYIDALDNVYVWEYDANSNVVATSVRDGQDGRNPGRVLDATAPVTLTHSLNHFDERNRLYWQEMGFFIADVSNGVITDLTTDGDGDGWAEMAYTYDRNGNTTAITDDNGNTTLYAFDGLGRLTLATDALNNSVAYVYDGNGNLAQTVATERQPGGLAADEIFTTTRVFDGANRLIQTIDNLGQTTHHGYDSRGNLVFASDPNGALTGETNDHGNTALFAYDGLGRTVEETHHLRAGGVGDGAVAGQATMHYTYDPNGNLVRRSDPNGNVTTYGYDALNRLTGATYADGTKDALVYDRENNLVQKIDANGNVVTHTYDALNRLVSSEVDRGAGVGGTTIQTWAWDGLSRRIAISDNNDPTTPTDDSGIGFIYDSLTNLRGEVQDSYTISSTYDGMGNRLNLTYPSGTVVTYTYDALNRIKTIADGGVELAEYDYIGPSRMFRRANGNGTYAAYTYDGIRRVMDVAHRLSSDDSLLTGFSYTYDRVGNRATETAQPGDATTTYTYDSLYRLTGAQGASSNFQYTYDAAGNRTRATEGGGSASYATNKVNAYLTVGGEHRTYDANGNLLSRRFITQEGEWFIYLPLVVRGSAGSMSNNHAPVSTNSLALNGATVVTETIISYEYDFANRLLGTMKAVTVTTDVDVQVVTETVRFTYDGLGRRASKQTGDSITRYLYDGKRVIEERDGTDTLLVTYIENLKMDGGGSHIVSYQTDGTGSVRALADDAGSVVERVNYEPFGAPIFGGGGSESSQGNPYLFHGLRYDVESGFYLSGVQQYDPITGCHVQRGDESFGNPYTFAGNNPVNIGPY